MPSTMWPVELMRPQCTPGDEKHGDEGLPIDSTSAQAQPSFCGVGAEVGLHKAFAGVVGRSSGGRYSAYARQVGHSISCPVPSADVERERIDIKGHGHQRKGGTSVFAAGTVWPFTLLLGHHKVIFMKRGWETRHDGRGLKRTQQAKGTS